MDKQSFNTRRMLLQYGRQLISSRRRFRYHELLGIVSEREAEASPDEQRRSMVERISREVVENLIFTGSANPIVQEVRHRLDQELEGRYSFQYPPGELDFKVMRQDSQGPVVVSSDEKRRIMGRLLDITRDIVSETML